MDDWPSSDEVIDRLMNKRTANSRNEIRRRVCQWCGRHKMERRGGYFICDTCDIPRGRTTELSHEFGSG